MNTGMKMYRTRIERTLHGRFIHINSGDQIMDKLNLIRTGSALAITAGIINLVCALAAYLFPDGTIDSVTDSSG
jgi:hypothetical protein